ncbi:MAG: chorismate mutase [Spirochaetota bacterium]
MDSVERYRRKVDKLDRRIINLLRKRYRTVKCIGSEKRKYHKPVKDQERENQIIRKIDTLVPAGKCRKYVKSVYRVIFRASCEAEDQSWTG